MNNFEKLLEKSLWPDKIRRVDKGYWQWNSGPNNLTVSFNNWNWETKAGLIHIDHYTEKEGSVFHEYVESVKEVNAYLKKVGIKGKITDK